MKNVDVLDLWASLGRSLRKATANRRPDWIAVDGIIGAAKPKLRADASDLRRLLQTSRRRLQPLEDPLDVDLGMHRWLSEDREESYSDWLQWVVEQLQDPRFVLPMFGIPLPADIATWKVKPTVLREITTEHGHDGQRGRLDLVIRYGDQAMIVVEVKKWSADDADTEKHRGYDRSLCDPRLPPERLHKIIVAAAGDQQEYCGFRLVRWDQICVFLRRFVVTQVGKESHVVLALMLAFIGAVEQNLLGLDAKHIRQVVEGNALLRLPALVDHLHSSLTTGTK